jgi:ABC-2 type transport system permease protein
VSVAVFITFTFISQVFVREKAERVIETLMCAPVTLRQVWLGKVLGIAIPSYLITVLSVALIFVIANLASHSTNVPSLATTVHVLAGVPTLIIAFGGLVGFGQLLLGMRENRLLNLLIFVPAFAAIYGSGYMVSRNSAVTWQHVGIIFAVCAFFVVATAYLARYLSKERIVTAIS